MTTVSRLGSAVALATALVLSPTASAKDDDHRRGPRWLDRNRQSHFDRQERHERNERSERRERYERYERSERGHHHGNVRFHGNWCGYRHQHFARAPFWCAPCGSGFGHLAAFHRHVHHHHHVPWSFVPGAVINVGFGWIFHG
jgi:Ni/Co efflux regulator RcnB